MWTEEGTSAYPTTIEADKKRFPTTGYSGNFIAFIEQEIQPFIEKKYKTTTSKMLIGQSLGGLLATEILLKKPTLFNKYIIINRLNVGTCECVVKWVVNPCREKERRRNYCPLCIGHFSSILDIVDVIPDSLSRAAHGPPSKLHLVLSIHITIENKDLGLNMQFSQLF